jgi:hypothetical protein
MSNGAGAEEVVREVYLLREFDDVQRTGIPVQFRYQGKLHAASTPKFSYLLLEERFDRAGFQARVGRCSAPWLLMVPIIFGTGPKETDRI